MSLYLATTSSLLAFFQAAEPSLISTFGLPIIIFAIFWFLVISPMRKRQKRLQGLIDNLKKGDKVVTTGGLHGEIAAIEASSVLLKVADGVKVRVGRAYVAGLQGDEDLGGVK